MRNRTLVGIELAYSNGIIAEQNYYHYSQTILQVVWVRSIA